MAHPSFLIVGQGIAGSLLALELMAKGYEVRIADKSTENTSSKKAAGLYNPITGRKMNITWLADRLFTGLSEYYQKLERRLEASFHTSIPIYRPFVSQEEQNDWFGKASDPRYIPFIRKINHKSLGIADLQDPYGGILLTHTGYVDLPAMLETLRKYFQKHDVLIDESVTPDDALAWGPDKVIFCEGPDVDKNHYWHKLPFRPVRGELLDIHCALPPDRIYNRGVFMLPKNGIFRVGSTYHHDILSYQPQKHGIAELQDRLTKLYTGKYDIANVSAGVRPATHDRRPYIGWHPENKDVGIFNGFGTKGVSLVPYFSKLFADSIEKKTNILPEADVSRVF